MMRTSVKQIVKSVVYYLPDRLHRWRRSRHLKSQRTHYSQSDIEADLDKLPIPVGAVVLVHSSLKAIGYVEGGAQAVVDALVASVVEKRNGTLLFPTFSISGTMYNTLKSGAASEDPVFDVRETPSNLGAIPETFRMLAGTARSIHPTHSFAALGPAADELVTSHHRCGTSFGPGSPMAEALKFDTYLLGLGTNLGNVTLYHCLEEIEDDFPFNVYTSDSPLTVTCRDSDGALHRLTLGAHDSTVSRTRIDRPENEAIRKFFTNWFEENAELAWHQVCEAKTWVVPASLLYSESAKLMRHGITIYSTPAELQAKGYQ